MKSLKVLSMLTAVLLVAACSEEPKALDAGAGAGNTTTTGPARTNLGGAAAELASAAVGDHVYFGFDKSDVSPEAKATLDRQVAWFHKYPSVTVSIEGNADERGTREYNLALGERRSSAVKNYLVAAGIDASRIATISYGKEKPEVLGSNEAAWAKNRRAVTVVVNQ